MSDLLAQLDVLLPDVPNWTRRSTENLTRTRGILLSRPGSSFAAVHLPRIDAELDRRGVLVAQ